MVRSREQMRSATALGPSGRSGMTACLKFKSIGVHLDADGSYTEDGILPGKAVVWNDVCSEARRHVRFWLLVGERFLKTVTELDEATPG